MRNDPGQSPDIDPSDQQPSAGQLRNFLRPCLLLLVDECPTYGYELHQRLGSFSPTRWDHGTIYRLLNLMEDEGLVLSRWQRSDRGPRRRAYQITDAGRQRLREYAQELSAIRNLIAVFLDRYERSLEAHVALLLGAAVPAPRPSPPPASLCREPALSELLRTPSRIAAPTGAVGPDSASAPPDR